MFYKKVCQQSFTPFFIIHFYIRYVYYSGGAFTGVDYPPAPWVYSAQSLFAHILTDIFLCGVEHS